MKRNFKQVVSIFVFLLVSFLLFGCNNKTVTVSYFSGDGNGTFEGVTIQEIKKGGTATEVKAIPFPGYIFDKWSDGITESSRTDKNIQNDLMIYAYFKKDEHYQIREALKKINDSLNKVSFELVINENNKESIQKITVEDNMYLLESEIEDDIEQIYYDGFYKYFLLEGNYVKEKTDEVKHEVYLMFFNNLKFEDFELVDGVYHLKNSLKRNYIDNFVKDVKENLGFTYDIFYDINFDLSLKLSQDRLDEFNITYLLKSDKETIVNIKMRNFYSDFIDIGNIDGNPSPKEEIRLLIESHKEDLNNATISSICTRDGINYDVNLLLDGNKQKYTFIASEDEFEIYYLDEDGDDRYLYMLDEEGLFYKRSWEHVMAYDLFIVISTLMKPEYFYKKENLYIMKSEYYAEYVDSISEYFGKNSELDPEIDPENDFYLWFSVVDNQIRIIDISFTNKYGNTYEIYNQYRSFGETKVHLPELITEDLNAFRLATKKIDTDLLNVKMIGKFQVDSVIIDTVIQAENNIYNCIQKMDNIILVEHYIETTEETRYSYENEGEGWEKYNDGNGYNDLDMYFVFPKCFTWEQFSFDGEKYVLRSGMFSSFMDRVVESTEGGINIEYTESENNAVNVWISDGHITKYEIFITRTDSEGETTELKIIMELTEHGNISLTLPDDYIDYTL